MDPSRKIIECRKSFEGGEEDWMKYLKPFSMEMPKISKEIKTNLISIERQKKPLLINIEEYEKLKEMQNKFDHPNFEKARTMTNPAEGIGKGIFLNRAAIKLANIDAIFNLTQSHGGFAYKRSSSPFVFADVAGGPGGFTEYIQYRKFNSLGYGITLDEKFGGIPWNWNRIKENYFKTTNGADNTGNLYNNANFFADWVLDNIPTGVNLVTADGGFETADYTAQELLSSHLILTEILVGLRITGVGQNFVLKIFDSIFQITIDCLFILACCFDEIHIFKPLSSRPANSERYVIAKSRRKDIIQFIEILQEANNQYKLENNDFIVTQLFSSRTTDFDNFLAESNANNLSLQTQTAQSIIDYLNNKPKPQPKYNLDRALIIWNLPSRPTTSLYDDNLFNTHTPY